MDSVVAGRPDGQAPLIARDPTVQYALPESPLGLAQVGVQGEHDLVRLAIELGAPGPTGPLSPAEQLLVERALRTTAPMSSIAVRALRDATLAGEDPLGRALYALRPAARRRESGTVYTPWEIVRPMVDWIVAESPDRLVDAGSGSGRFTLELLKRKSNWPIIAVDSDPIAALMTRAVAATVGARHVRVLNSDYTTLDLPWIMGRTAFVGNPPYVRHHNLAPQVKAWAQITARALGYPVSGLAGLHAYFFLATARLAKSGDVGCFVTSSEWLDVNYGAIIRELLLGKLGGYSVCMLEPTSLPFAEAATTAAISCFQVGVPPDAIRLRSVTHVAELGRLGTGQPIAAARLAEAPRWSSFVRTSRKPPAGYVELGELCRVHRGAVTGLNAVWVTNANDDHLPQQVLFPSVTRARELFDAGDRLVTTDGLRRVIDIPSDLDLFEGEERRLIELFLIKAKKAGAADGYIARNRRSWWAVGLRTPAPILATYMARRAPAFVRNVADARHINIAHGLYPREAMPESALDRLAAALRSSITVAQGRTYAGGLTKFEPKEMERLPIPDLPALLAS